MRFLVAGEDLLLSVLILCGSDQGDDRRDDDTDDHCRHTRVDWGLEVGEEGACEFHACHIADKGSKGNTHT